MAMPTQKVSTFQSNPRLAVRAEGPQSGHPARVWMSYWKRKMATHKPGFNYTRSSFDIWFGFFIKDNGFWNKYYLNNYYQTFEFYQQ
jgi:hypothetical protein